MKLHHNSRCPECKAELEIDVGFSGSYFEPPEPPYIVCTECDWSPDMETIDWQDFDTPALTEEQKNEIDELTRELWRAREQAYVDLEEEIAKNPLTIDDLFKYVSEDVFDFDSDPEDVGNAYNCGDSDCESGWHQDCGYHSMGRDQNGKRWYVAYRDSISGCGDYQPLCGFDEREGDEPTPEVLAELQYHFSSRSINHFAGWAEYDLYCAETGKDPLDNWHRPFTADDAIKAAKDNLRYLQMRKKN